MAEQSDDLLRVASEYVGPIREAWLNTIRNFLSSVSDNQILSVLQKEGYYTKSFNGIDDLMDMLGGYIAEDVVPRMTDAWMASGRKTSSVLPRGAITGNFSFDTARVSALSAAEGYRAKFVTEATRAQRQTISQIINRGFVEGRSRAAVAREIRASIGLTSTQEKWVSNYRNQLSTLDPAALERALRDQRSDKLLRRLMESGNTLSTEQIDSMVERYRQRLIKFRAETIARTESLRAMRMGEWDALMAAQDAGVLSPFLKRFWVTTADERLRRFHLPIPSMNSDGRAVDEPFQTPLGLMMYPLDPSGTAANVVNCRCRVVYRMPTASGQYKDVPMKGRLPADLVYAANDGL